MRWFAQFEGADHLKRKQVVSLIEWRFDGATEMEHALGGVTGPRPSGHAKRCITKALGTTNATAPLDCLVGDSGGIPGWGPDMASVVLAACRPDTYLVADHRALCALRGLDLYCPRGDDEFTRADWWPYLRICRKLAVSSGVSLREVGHALRAAGNNAPALPVPPVRT
jgi:hypothetical protein